MKITRELLNSCTGTIAGATVVYSDVLEVNSGVRIGDGIEAAEAVELLGDSLPALFSGVVTAGEEVYLTTPEGKEIAVAEFELFIIAVTSSNGYYNCDYTVFALEEIEENI